MTDQLLSYIDTLSFAQRAALIPALRAARRSQTVRSEIGELIGTRLDLHAIDRAVMRENERSSALQLLHERGSCVPTRSETIAALERLILDALVVKDPTGKYRALSPKELP
jgi:hypothetical protein